MYDVNGCVRSMSGHVAVSAAPGEYGLHQLLYMCHHGLDCSCCHLLHPSHQAMHSYIVTHTRQSDLLFSIKHLLRS